MTTANKPIPEYLIRPKYEPRFDIIFKAIRDLESERSITMGGVTLIPYRAKIAFAEVNQITGDDLHDFLYIMDNVDHFMVKYYNKKE